MVREIGGEFWSASPQNKKYFLSGRTALEFIVRDIVSEYKVRSVLMPAYCCHSMIDPFIRHGISVRFYDIFYKDGQLSIRMPEFQREEIFFYMEYFGFTQILSGKDLLQIRANYPTIINDRTHSWLADRNDFIGDYSFVSFRKWNGFSGIAEARKAVGDFSITQLNLFHDKYVSMREEAVELKKYFIENQVNNKNKFLGLLHEAEDMLDIDFVGYKPSYKSFVDLLSTDWTEVKEKRRRNAKILMDGLKDIDGIHLMFEQMDKDNVPLFMPIIVEEDRDKLIKYLIDKAIYCPVHWGLSKQHIGISELSKGLYESELSIPCDQRYGENDMNKIVESICNYYR